MVLVSFKNIYIRPSYGAYVHIWAYVFLCGASKPNQKMGPLGGLFGLTAISKSCFRYFQGLGSEYINLPYMKVWTACYEIAYLQKTIQSYY